MVLDDLTKYRSAPLSGNVNFLKIPVTVFDINEGGAEEWNEIYKLHKSLEYATPIVRTESGGISIDRKDFTPPSWDVIEHSSCLELTSLMLNGMRRFQFRQDIKSDVTAMGGRKAITLFSRHLKRISGISLKDYKISDGMRIRKEVPKYLIQVNKQFIHESSFIEDAKTFHHVHHADFHQSFPAGLANTHPEFRDTIEYFYTRRKKHPEYKGALNSLIGIMWSPSFQRACYANLARDAISDNNCRVLNLTKHLEDSGRIPLLWNTDGVWYMGDVYHGQGEGSGIGQWENDHVDCTFRVKSRGAYEFIENGIYHSVVRGIRKEEQAGWKWGDIFSPHTRKQKYFEFNVEEGIRCYETIEI